MPVLKNTTDLVKGNKLVILVKPNAKPLPIEAVIERESGKAPPAKKQVRSEAGLGSSHLGWEVIRAHVGWPCTSRPSICSICYIVECHCGLQGNKA